MTGGGQKVRTDRPVHAVSKCQHERKHYEMMTTPEALRRLMMRISIVLNLLDNTLDKMDEKYRSKIDWCCARSRLKSDSLYPNHPVRLFVPIRNKGHTAPVLSKRSTLGSN